MLPILWYPASINKALYPRRLEYLQNKVLLNVNNQGFILLSVKEVHTPLMRACWIIVVEIGSIYHGYHGDGVRVAKQVKHIDSCALSEQVL